MFEGLGEGSEEGWEGGVSGVGGGGGPGVEFGAFDDFGAEGIAFDVGEGGDGVVGVAGDGVEAALPEVSGEELGAVEVAGVFGVGDAEGAGEGIGEVGDGDPVNVVGHEAVAEEAGPVAGGVVGDELEVELAMGVGGEDGAGFVAALDDVVPESGDGFAGGAGHV